MPEFSTDGPHSPETTSAAAAHLAQTVRYLNYATMLSSDGLEYPGDVYSLLGSLTMAMERMPQLMRQLSVFMTAQSASGRLADHTHADAAQWARVVARDLNTSADRFTDMARDLSRRQSDLADMYVKDGDND